MSLLHHPHVQRHARRHLLCRVEGPQGTFALTFDDGPSERWTPRLLDLLRAHQARATFFVLGRRVRRRPEVIERALAEGHEIGVHGDLHLPPALLPIPLLAWEIARARDALAALVPDIRHYRPPFGWLLPDQAAWVRRQGLLPVLGDVYPRDVERPGAEIIVQRVLARLAPGSIVILHDASGFGDFDRAQTLAAVERILAEASLRGLAAVSVRELLEHGRGVDADGHRRR